MEHSRTDFGHLREDRANISSELQVPEFTAGETLEESPPKKARDDMDLINEKLLLKVRAQETRDSLGELSANLDERTIERVGALDVKLGEKYTQQRPEIRIAIAQLPESGLGLKESEKGEVEKGQEIVPENLVFVRLTDHLPVETDGKKKVLTAYNATADTDDPTYRLTSHWTINNVVRDHTLGTFEGSRVAILVPGQEMLRENGAPDALLPVDTFWHKDLEIPDSAVIFSYDEDPASESIILEEDDDLVLITTLSMEAIGYTTVNNHPTYTVMKPNKGDYSFDKGVINLGKSIGIEDSRLHIDMMTKETAIENFFHPGLGGEHPASALERMATEYWTELPPKIKVAIVDRLAELSATEGTVEDKHTIYQALDSLLVDFMEKFDKEARRPFIESLPHQVIIDCMVNEFSYWMAKENANPQEMLETRVAALSEYLKPHDIELISEEVVKKLGILV